MKSLIPPLIEPDSGPPKPPWPIDAAAAAAEPPPEDLDELEDDEDAELVVLRDELEDAEEPLPNRFDELPRKPPLAPELAD